MGCAMIRPSPAWATSGTWSRSSSPACTKSTVSYPACLAQCMRLSIRVSSPVSTALSPMPWCAARQNPTSLSWLSRPARRLPRQRTGGSLSTHLIVALPLVLWVMIGFFEDVPGELIEAARIDGCSHFSAFLRVALPLVKPGIVATAILGFIFSWNNFLFSLIIAGFKTRTLPIAVYNFLSYEEINWGGLTAAATIITLPVLILSLFIQKHIVRGLTLGALKG